MVKNALQAQLLKAGLVDNKQVKKANNQNEHAKRTGHVNTIKQDITEAQIKKAVKDQLLNSEKQHAIEHKSLISNISQMIEQYQIQDTNGDTAYQFIDQNKVKKIYVKPEIYNQIINGKVAIVKKALHMENYAILPTALADKIEKKLTGFIVVLNQDNKEVTSIEDDPYKDYVIPDDLMW